MTRVLIAGAGIGGLTSALSLAELGFDVEVFESTPELKPLGVGINLLPHAVRELYELGLSGPLERLGVMTSELSYFNKYGQPIWSEPRGLAAGYRWPQISIHRGELQMLLLRTAQERLGAGRVHLGQRLVSAEHTPHGVRARFVTQAPQPADPAHEPQRGQEFEVEADLLIGADGIHSQLRAQLHPNEGPPRWNHAIMWRGVTEGEAFLSGRTMIMAGHSAQKFVCYPIEHRGSKRALINWVAELRLTPEELAERGGLNWSWNRRAELEEFLPSFEPWRFEWLNVPELIRGAQAVYVYPMVDREPLDHWGERRCTLLGDAAHPMHPVGSNGASQAILDARVLAGCLRRAGEASEPGDIDAALRTYEGVRRPLTSAIILANRVQGPELCMTLAEERAPRGFARVDDVIAHSELEAIALKYKRVAGFSIDELNQRPSLAHVQY